MAVTLDKILNISLRDYVESQGKTLQDYELRGVHSPFKDVGGFAGSVPTGAEVVVNYQYNVAGKGFKIFGENGFEYNHTGTALIPKKQ